MNQRGHSNVAHAAIAIVACGTMLVALPSTAATLSGTLEVETKTQPKRVLGFVRVKIATGSAHSAADANNDRNSSLSRRKRREALKKHKDPAEYESVALFLKVKNSLPTQSPSDSEIFEIKFSQMRLTPRVAACVVDGKVRLVNDTKESVTFEVANQPLQEVPPSGSVVYGCTTGAEFRSVRITQWPHIQGAIYVKEVGVVAKILSNGKFSVDAPKGTYALQIVGLDRVLREFNVRLGDADKDLGTITLNDDDRKGTQ